MELGKIILRKVMSAKCKVDFILEEAMKAQMESTGTALIFL
jgi:hypothetical protein